MATSYPPMPKYVTVDDLEKLVTQLRYNTSPQTQFPQARIDIASDGSESLELGNFILTASSPTSGLPNQIVVRSAKTGKVAITITETQIIIGNPQKENIVLEL